MADLAIWANTQEENSVKLSDVVFSCEKTFAVTQVILS